MYVYMYIICTHFMYCTCIFYKLLIINYVHVYIINCYVGSGEQEIKLHILDVQLSYYNEYLGCKRLPIFTPRTNNYIISLSQVNFFIDVMCKMFLCDKYTYMYMCNYLHALQIWILLGTCICGTYRCIHVHAHACFMICVYVFTG